MCGIACEGEAEGTQWEDRRVHDPRAWGDPEVFEEGGGVGVHFSAFRECRVRIDEVG